MLSDEVVSHWAKQFPHIYGGSFVDYYVARLWEDILDMLPDVLEPLPSELSNFFEKDEDAWFQWESNALNWIDNQPDEDKVLDRKTWLDQALKKSTSVYWNDVLAANSAIARL
jgi:hypothetical protein